MRIGVFDSGIGGEAIAHELRKEFPHADIITVSDRKHMPYGNRERSDIIELTDTAIIPFIQSGCDVIVLACNTATAAAIETLRERHPTQPFIGLEPMIKPAADLTKTGVIAVLATPATLGSERYLQSKHTFTGSITIVEPDCSNWANLIEASEMNRDQIDSTIRECIKMNADVIVLGCTHYHWIKHEIAETAGLSGVVLEPSEAIARRVRELLHIS